MLLLIILSRLIISSYNFYHTTFLIFFNPTSQVTLYFVFFCVYSLVGSISLSLTLLSLCDTLFLEKELLTGFPVVIDKLVLSRAAPFFSLKLSKSYAKFSLSSFLTTNLA